MVNVLISRPLAGEVVQIGQLVSHVGEAGSNGLVLQVLAEEVDEMPLCKFLFLAPILRSSLLCLSIGGSIESGA